MESIKQERKYFFNRWDTGPLQYGLVTSNVFLMVLAGSSPNKSHSMSKIGFDIVTSVILILKIWVCYSDLSNIYSVSISIICRARCIQKFLSKAILVRIMNCIGEIFLRQNCTYLYGSFTILPILIKMFMYQISTVGS